MVEDKNISGKIYWFNDKDKNGYKTGRYICYYCYFGIERHSPNYDNSGIKVCDICKSTKTFTRSDGKEYWYNHRDENYLKTGKYICYDCYQKYDPNSQSNTKKMLAKHRSNISDLDITNILGDISQKVVGYILNVPDLNKEHDNYCWPYDFMHKEYGTIDSQGRMPQKGEYWMFKGGKNCDTYFLLGFVKDLMCIETVHIIPNDEWSKKTISISRNRDISRYSMYDKYKVDPKIYDDTYHKLFDVEEIEIF